MMKHQWLLALPLALGLGLASGPADASEIRDRAGMFSPDAVRSAQKELDRIEANTGVPVVIETIETVSGLDKNAPLESRREVINSLAVKRDEDLRAEGIYLLLSKKDRLISNVLVRKKYAGLIDSQKRIAIRDSFIPEFKKERFDAGLGRAVDAINSQLSTGARREAKVRAMPVLPGPGADPAPAPHARQARGAQFGLGSLLTIGLGILAILFVFRLIGSLFNRSGAGPGYGGPGGIGRPGMGPGYGGPGYGGPGYGGPGYGGGQRGGFLSGLMGGLGGAIAGNWIYDQFSGRHGEGHVGSSAYGAGEGQTAYDPSGEAITGADDPGGAGGNWDDAGGGGDWTGGDGGGDWGGGGGDGGGDWGGGGGDGGDW